MIRLCLYAAGTDELLASFPIEGALVNPARRLVGGLAVPYNVVGRPNGLPPDCNGARFLPGSLDLGGGALDWNKLLIAHDRNQSVGFLQSQRETEAGMLAVYQVAEGPAGDAALQGVVDRTRDALSVGVEVFDFGVAAGQILEVRRATWRETSLLAIPAYASARATLAASLSNNERQSIMAQLADMLHLTATGPGAPADPATPASPQGNPDTGTPPTAPATGTPQAAPATVQASVDPQALATALAAALGAQRATGLPGEAPAGTPPTTPARRGIATVEAAAAAVAAWQTEGGQNVAELTAALNDVVPANDAGGASGIGNDAAPQWLGELWTARQSARPFVDALGTPRPLTGLKARGWRWVTRPEVDDYAGNKAAIPSNPVATEPAEADAHRTAGGWDVDRVFFDLGDASFITSLFQAAAEDYAVKSNAWLGAQLLAAAVAADADGLGSSPSLVAALGAMGAASGAIGAQITWLAMAPDVFAEFSGLTRDEVPWWVGGGDNVNLANSQGSVGGFKFWADPLIPAGTYLGGDRRAATYYEKGSTPIRVQAVNIPQGGVDLAVFGYNSMIVNDERALFHGAIA